MNALGIIWDRTPQNYENYKPYFGAMQVIGTDGSFSIYKG